jgi:uncharacterized protein (DUF58 family)
VRGLWIQLQGVLAKRIRYKITRGGVLFTAAILVVGWGAAMMATLLVSGLVSRLCLAALELDFLVPEHAPARREIPGKLYVRNQKWLMPSFSIRVEGVREPDSPALKSGVYFPLIAAGTTVEETLDVCFPRRGAYRQNTFAFSTSFPFGFLEKSARVTTQREMIVYPSIDPHPGFEHLLAGIAGEIETHYRGLGRDFYRIRPYEALESARHVDWKASAHVGSLQIREFAREKEQTVEMFLDRDIPQSLDHWFEHAIECCAFLAWRLSTQGACIHFRSNGYEFRQPEDGDIYTILKYLALVYAQTGSAQEAPLDETSYQIVFTPSPGRFAEAGWMGARIISPDVLRIPDRGAAAAGNSET